jgi:hypothetical protein
MEIQGCAGEDIFVTLPLPDLAVSPDQNQGCTADGCACNAGDHQCGYSLLFGV